ncbi:MAG: DUF1634 domain-containing protein [Sphingomonadaceae bacterium]
MEDREGRLDDVIASVLLAGSAAGLLSMILGLALMLAGRPLEGPAGPSPWSALQGALMLSPIGLMDTGILILVATPVVRVIALVFGFLWEHRPRFALVSLAVLALLGVSFVVASGV